MKKLKLLLTFVLLFSSQPFLSTELTILTENLPPLNYLKDGKLIGPSVEILKEIQKRVGSHAEIQVYPWAQSLSNRFRG